MKDNNYKIDIEIYIVFIIVISISVFNAVYSSLNITKNQEVNNRIMAVDIPSLQSLENMNLLVTRSEMLITNWTYIFSNKEDKEKLKRLQFIEYPQLKNDISLLMSEWKDKENAENMRTIFQDFEQLISWQKQIMEKLSDFDDYQDPMKKFSSEEIVEGQIIPRSAQIISMLNKVVVSKKNQANILHAMMRSSYQTLMWSVLGIAIMVVIVILLAAFYMSDKIIVPLMKLKNRILQMGRGEIPDIESTRQKNAVGLMTEAVRKLSESLKRTAGFANDIGKGNFKVSFEPLGPHDELGNALIQMRESLSNVDAENRQRQWFANGLNRLSKVLQENTDDIGKLSDEIINSLVKFLNAWNGAIYLMDQNLFTNEPFIELKGSYAFHENQKLKKQFAVGEGVIGQSVKDRQTIYLKNAPLEFHRVNSGLGKTTMSHVLVVPLKHRGEIYGAIELASFSEFREHEIKFIESIGETMGSTIASSKANTLTKQLLDETRKQAERLTAQEEELRQTNEEISNQSSLLQVSEEELKQSNIELKEKAKLVEEQNERLEQARGALSLKVKELELNSKYKSEFLANMSHELRTPLNSVLILAKLLSDNKNKTLSEKEIDYAKVIYKSGNDLVALINDILDLSKIEAGKMELNLANERVQSINDDMQALFAELAIQKKIEFSIEQYSNIPEYILTDKLRLEQIIKNLLSNAFKFTDEGGAVTLRIKFADRPLRFNNQNLFRSKQVLEFSVADTGIGIPLEKQQLIFEAFQQEDGSTSRKYGGTGLGLSISKMLVSLLGGEMQLVSEKGKGSTFFIFIPLESISKNITVQEIGEGDQNQNSIAKGSVEYMKDAEPYDDRGNLKNEDKIILIVEDDLNFAKLLVDFAHDKHYKAIVATHGDEGIRYAEEIIPAAIILDMQLPVMNCWKVMERLKKDKRLSQIPIHVLSGMDKSELGLEMGATTFLRKPLDKRDLDKTFNDIERMNVSDIRRVLIVENEIVQAEILKNLIQNLNSNVKIDLARNFDEACKSLERDEFECVFLNLDLGHTPLSGLDVLEFLKMKGKSITVPVIVYTNNEIFPEVERKVKEYANSVFLRSEESCIRIIDEAALFLKKIGESNWNFSDQYNSDCSRDILFGKSILIADDDMRNIYALTNLLENRGMIVLTATDGRDAFQKISKSYNIDIFLIDTMIPGMNGLTLISEIRNQEGCHEIPIVIQTTGSQPGFREKYINAGASDFISKPIIGEQLLSLLRVWICKA